MPVVHGQDLWRTSAGELYRNHPAHRNGTPGKTQWCVTKPIEAGIFEGAPGNVVANDAERWGLYELQGRLEEVGNDGEFVSRFIGPASPPLEWHGFPAGRWPGDRIPDELLDQWVQQQRLTRAKARKLRTGSWRL